MTEIFNIDDMIGSGKSNLPHRAGKRSKAAFKANYLKAAAKEDAAILRIIELVNKAAGRTLMIYAGRPGNLELVEDNYVDDGDACVIFNDGTRMVELVLEIKTVGPVNNKGKSLEDNRYYRPQGEEIVRYLKKKRFTVYVVRCETAKEKFCLHTLQDYEYICKNYTLLVPIGDGLWEEEKHYYRLDDLNAIDPFVWHVSSSLTKQEAEDFVKLALDRSEQEL